MNSSIKKSLITILSIFSLFLISFIISLIVDNDVIFPNPINWIIALFDLSSNVNTYLIIIYTLIRLLFALLISLILGIIIGLFSLKFETLHMFLKPYFYIFRSVPLVSIILIIMVLFNLKIAPILITILVSLPIIYDGVYIGIKNIDKEVLKASKIETGFNLRILSKIYIPLSWPTLKNSIIQAISLSIKVLIMSEFICGTPNSIGNVLNSAANNLEYSYLFAWSIIIIIIVVLINNLSKLLNLTVKERTID